MAKCSGKIGFVITQESADSDRPSVWETSTIERNYKIEVQRNNWRYRDANKVNYDLTISNSFSVLADSFAVANAQYARYIIYQGVKWSIDSVEIAYPRLNITAGGVYNG